MTNSFTILGSGAGPGVPSFFCDCCGCREAHLNPLAARTRSGALVKAGEHNLLIDTSPDLRAQLLREEVTSVDGVFLTHWHYDHFGGLGELEYYVRLIRKEPLPLWLPPSAVPQFKAAFPNLEDIFNAQPWRFDEEYRQNDVSLTPLPARHGVETAGFLIATENQRLAYFPDTAGLDQLTIKRLHEVDWLICDATFSGTNWFPESHMSIDQAIDLGIRIKARETILTHMSIHYSLPLTLSALQESLPAGNRVRAAFDGMTLNLEQERIPA